MKVIIIGSSIDVPTPKEQEYYQQYVDFFAKSAQNSTKSVEVFSALLEDLFIQVGEGIFSIFDTRNQLNLSEYACIFFRGSNFKASMDVVVTINEYAKKHGIPTVNSYANFRDSSKLLQASNFESIGVPVAQTLLVNTALFEHFDTLENWKFPCIMKARYGSHGDDNYLVKNLNEVREISVQSSDKGFVLQRFIENDGDFRILLVGDEALVIGRSAQEGSHLNNTSQGGAATLIDSTSVPEAVLNDARKITQFYGMTIAGVDVLQSKESGEYFFLEVNSQPQLMTGAFVDKKEQMLGKLFDTLRD